MIRAYFSSVFTKEYLAMMPDMSLTKNSYLPNITVERLEEIDITKLKVTEALASMKQNKAAGEDGLHSSYLLSIGDCFVEHLTILFSKSMESSEVPENWKTANITAIFKKGNKQVPGNYRPVSLTSHI